MNKKGIIQDFPYLMMFLVVASFLILVGYITLDTMNTAVQNETLLQGQGTNFLNNLTTRFPAGFDQMIGILFFGFMIIGLGLAWFLATNSIAFFIVWIIVVFVMGFSGFLANAWIESTSTGVLAAAVTNFPMIDFIMNYYLFLTLVQAFLMLIFFFAKQQRGGV